jgi:hypothetical protein
MAKYLLLYGPGKMPETEEERNQVFAAWDTWMKDVGSALVDPGNPFSPTAKRITRGPAIVDTPATAGGYSVIEADSLDQAAKYASGCPVLQGDSDVTVFETFDVM